MCFHRNNINLSFQPENIMLSDKVSPNPNIKLIDFGLAHLFLPGEEYRSTSGTPQYIGEYWCSFDVFARLLLGHIMLFCA